MFNKYDLNNKKILITGAAGQLGRDVVKALVNNGAFVYATDLKAGDHALPKERCQFLTMDVTSEQSVREAAEKIGDLDVLINNAGIGIFTPFEQRKTSEIDQAMDVNLKGTILCTKIFSELFIKKGKGKIINIGSIYGVVAADKKIYGDSGRNSSEIYAATKAGVIQMTKYFAAYFGDKNIQVNSVSPGGIFNNQKQFFVDNYVAKTPAGRMAETGDLTGIICFLASEDSNYLTGQNITVDGGFSLNQ